MAMGFYAWMLLALEIGFCETETGQQLYFANV
jgi:hypothetical protein